MLLLRDRLGGLWCKDGGPLGKDHTGRDEDSPQDRHRGDLGGRRGSWPGMRVGRGTEGEIPLRPTALDGSFTVFLLVALALLLLLTALVLAALVLRALLALVLVVLHTDTSFRWETALSRKYS